MPSFRKLANTLTCLMLVAKFDSGGFCYQDVKGLFDSLRLPTCGIGLKGLWIHVVALSPELLDLMAGSLTNLEKLKLSYTRLVGDDNDQRTGDKNVFFEKMESRSYPDWGLRYLDVESWARSPGDRIPPEFLRRTIPSLREVGTIDWGDVELKIGPWY
ncbi:hypothetical protein BDN72DRAFT_305580 [Pluteus cervinus]|uniref:Uncharacterized protein n=1 Tax=Pluteus cervinus TaxID=181527 RepID=A0ACD3ACR5_9AGAR|nr:hypothetical protein BDN72DRAFT_305580 [Pluteus cervinus]